MILDKIVAKKKARLLKQEIDRPMKDIRDAAEKTDCRRRDFYKALSDKRKVNLIAEVKKASPSKGLICEDFNPSRLAYMYEFAEASAISVLTEEDFFLGSPSYLKSVRETTMRPVLRKDFIVDEYQIYETAEMCADAVLLIATILSADEIRTFISKLKEFDIQALVEVHTREDLIKALDAGADIIGINNRDLYTFEVKLETTERLAKMIPDDKIIVSESGIRTYNDIARLRSFGARAFLIGETIVRSPDIIATIRGLRGVGI